MNEQARLQELISYKILDTPPERELDELAELASAICDTPISLVSFIDENRQWFKAKKGVEAPQTHREDSFCQHVLHSANEVLIVEDPLNDDRFKNNPFVLGNPNIRFYAGAPLETPQGNVLGALCIIDNKPRTISEAQKNALKLLAKKAMDYLETRKLVISQNDRLESNAARLKQLTDQAPGAIYQLEMQPNGKISFPFISKGITIIHPGLDPKELQENAEIAFTVVHPDDLALVKDSLQYSFVNLTNWTIEYRIVSEDGKIFWHWANAKPERKDDGTVVWYGTFQDISESKEYINTLERILFDISHVMRRPVATMLGLTTSVEWDDLDEEMLKRYSGCIKTVAQEMDEYIRKLNADYNETRAKATGNNYSSFL